MTLRAQALPPVPEATVAAVQAAFPKGNLYVELRAEFGILYEDQLFADLYPPSGRPVEVAPLGSGHFRVKIYAKAKSFLLS
jgi:transposase